VVVEGGDFPLGHSFPFATLAGTMKGAIHPPVHDCRPMFEQTFKNIDDVLWKEAGCTTELDYTE